MYQIYFPTPALRPYIQVYWMVRSADGQPESIRENVFVDGRADIVFNFGSAYQRHTLNQPDAVESMNFSNLDGQREYPVAIAQDGMIDLVGVRFQPGGLSAVLTLPPTELSNQTLELRVAFGTEAAELENRLYDAPSLPERVTLLDAFFLRRLLVSSPYDFARYVAHFIETAAGAVNMKYLSAEVGYSIRRVDRSFRQCFGLTPKFYARVVRFQRALRMLSAESASDLTALALACGYYDQSHLAHEFADFTGQSPTLYRAHLLARMTAPPPNLVQFLQAS
jgi:AraC-like DNA-binding protein